MDTSDIDISDLPSPDDDISDLPVPGAATSSNQPTRVGPFGGEFLVHEATGFGASAVAGTRSLYDLAKGTPLSEIDKKNQALFQQYVYQPKGKEGEAQVKAFESPLNPLNWPSMGLDWLGDQINKATGSTAAGPITAGAGKLALAAAPMLLKNVSLPSISERATPGWGPEVPAEAPATAIDTEPVEGGLPKDSAVARAQVLQRVGLENARNSALEGDAKAAATDFQLSKFDEPAGAAAKAQFDAERQALQSHAQGIIERTGGTLGTDEDSLNLRGQTIAKPFDDLQDWFDTQRSKLYAEADARGGGAVQPTNLQGLLKDPSFQNQLTARGQTSLLNGVNAELGRFMKNNPEGLTVQNAEQFRQFLNTVWSPDNSRIIGQLKGALDEDVTQGAGEDVYAPARALSQLEKQTLQNPNGIARLLERDPQTPINRTTPYTKIPDTLTRLDPAQFAQVVKTLQGMPEEIQPQAQAALGEIKAHLANKVLDAGNSTAGQWNARGVAKVLDANAAKLPMAFNPEELQQLQDLKSAGNILSVNQGYPGAAAQAANALKRGFMTKALGRLGGAAGAAVGGVAGPWGAAGGAAAGELGASKLAGSLSEKAALRHWQAGTTKLSDLMGGNQ